VHIYAINIILNYKYILCTEVVYINYFASNLKIYINKKLYYNNSLSLNKTINLISISL